MIMKWIFGNCRICYLFGFRSRLGQYFWQSRKYSCYLILLLPVDRTCGVRWDGPALPHEDECIPTGGCGDGKVSGDEECDDGNRINDDGCDINCTFTQCGNGILLEGNNIGREIWR